MHGWRREGAVYIHNSHQTCQKGAVVVVRYLVTLLPPLSLSPFALKGTKEMLLPLSPPQLLFPP